MQRPSAAREAPSFSPLVQASWADASRFEGIPLIAARAKPFVLFAWRPAAERAADARRFRLDWLFIFLKLAFWNKNRIVRDRSHAYSNRTRNYHEACSEFPLPESDHQSPTAE